MPEHENHTTSTLIDKRRSAVFGTCLGLSVGFHAVAVLLVLIGYSTPGRDASVQYIDLASATVPVPVQQASSVIHAPAPPPMPPQSEQQAPPENAADVPPPLTPATEVLRTSLGRGMASGYFSSLAEGRSLRDDIREYYFNLLETVNTRWWQRAETMTETAQRDGVIDITIRGDGVLLGVDFIRGTGSREVDRAIVEVLEKSAPFQPLPANYGLPVFRAPLKISAPSTLFRIGNIR